MIQHNPRHWQVLENGSEKQHRAFEILNAADIFRILKPFDPAHVGTIGNDIDISTSDIDIICACGDLAELASILKSEVSDHFLIQCKMKESEGQKALVARISTEIPIEIYAEDTPTEKQIAYRHYLNACRVLDLLGDQAHGEIRTLKREGMKTEAAFCSYLGLIGEPFAAFLKVEEMSDESIRLLRAAQMRMER